MKITLSAVSKGGNGLPLPTTTVEFESGRITLVAAEGGDRPVVLSLIASGRMKPDAGTVTLDGTDDVTLLSERVALVDAPEVSEPPADLTLRTVLREELVYAGRSASGDHVDAAIEDALRANAAATEAASTAATDATATATDHRTPHDLARLRMADIDPTLRIRLLTELAAQRPGVQALVLCLPDRHGGDPRAWLPVATDLAARDFAVLLVCATPSAHILRPLLPTPTPTPTSVVHSLPQNAAPATQNNEEHRA